MGKVFGILLMLAGGIGGIKVIQAISALSEFNKYGLGKVFAAAQDQIRTEIFIWAITSLILFGLGLYLFFKEDKDPSQTDDGKNDIINQPLSPISHQPVSLDLSNDSTKIYLVSKYKITKNDVLNGYILNQSIYQSLDDVLKAALEIESLANNNKQEFAASSKYDPDSMNEALVILRKLEKYGYNHTNTNPSKGTWSLKSDTIEFDNNLEQLRSLLRNFEK